MKWLIVLMSLLLVGCAAKVEVPIVTRADIIKGMGESTVALMVMDEESISVNCTGVWVGIDRIMTADHCLDKEEVIFIMVGEDNGVDKRPKALHFGSVEKRDSVNDLGLIRTREKLVHRVAGLSMTESVVGDDVHIVGHVRGMYWTYMRGVVSGYREGLRSPARVMQVSAPIFFGNSGGGIFNDAGELVGITSFIGRAPNMGFTATLDPMREIMK